MDFHSLLRRDLQFLCKINKIPANMTNLAMADALKSLETSLDGELDQESVIKNVKFDVAKTPAVRSTRKASCSSKAQESKKVEMVQSAYSTRRSTRLLEKCMADLSLKTKETLDKPESVEETEQEVSAQEKNPAGSEEGTEDAAVILVRDLSASMEKEWEVLKNDDDDTAPVLEHSNTEITNDNKESKNLETFESLVQVDHQVTEQAVEEKDSEPEKTNTFHEETMGDQTDGDSEAESEGDDSGVDSDGTISEADSDQADHQEIEEATQENDSEAEKIITLDEYTMVETDGDSESEQEGDDSGIDSNGTISEADSNQVDHHETEQATHENYSETEKINAFDEDTMVEQTGGDSDTESEGDDDDSGAASDGTISEADSYQAIQGTDIADGKVILPESEGSITAPTSPLVLEEAPVETAPVSPFVAEESVSAQFPRPNKSASKNSAMKLVDVDNTSKENSMEMMMMMLNVVNGEIIGEEAAKKNEKVDIDEENLKDVSIRKLVKMVKKLSIKSSNNRTALQMLPGNNQIAE
ncbi:hypothetical protein IGI04_009435 [Brassica rapa subsp. trilocularis]|uniref:Uncharacterized protein n=1 Tax=Brassica rapa subsp. trilocularis TaxID=1813537 RepID=A0ABQ7MZN4_BRACM|nr:hypothetical protein IGI04_009435 [Brassica rapa subsp. trilocularis]